eukprot:TRINITY_DN42453_c0_g1_i1.p1 TRINITY_DN42453_c0_g1~~TRINITY_DN42453_c0_g1_i1.p1  ORF type:complete len:238 (-),score=36.24 TRINITY_DN42453_c0_g1_i1:243-956(-)
MMAGKFATERAKRNELRRKWQRARELAATHRELANSGKERRNDAAELGQPASGNQSALEPMEEDPQRFLWRFGYFRPGKPQLEILVDGHEEDAGHTFYILVCTLRHGAKVLRWQCKKRLSDLRGLHDEAKALLGQDAYSGIFVEAPFARAGGLPGTTGRLRVWLERLAQAANGGRLPTQLLATLVRFLEAPIPQESDTELQRMRDMVLGSQSHIVELDRGTKLALESDDRDVVVMAL